jgi:hypothetical protein
MFAVEIAVFYTIAAAVLCWAAAEALGSRAFWTAGAVLALCHSVVAFMVFYDGSHDIAQIKTTQQTAALTGVVFSGGIYVNYLFLLLWLGDAAWWWAAPASHRAQPRRLALAVRGFIFFVIVNGAVIFADGWARLVGLVALVVAAVGGWRRGLAPR